jgi:hypothetical protein
MTQTWEPCPLCGEEPIYVENGGYCAECGQLHDVTNDRILLQENLSGHIIRKGYGEPEEYIEQSILHNRERKDRVKRLKKVGGRWYDKVGWRG